MEEIEKTLKSYKWTEETIIRILLNSNNKTMLKEVLPMIRKYTNAIVINYSQDLNTSALVSIGDDTISLA